MVAHLLLNHMGSGLSDDTALLTLQRELQQPAITADPVLLAQLFGVTYVQVSVLRPPDFDVYPGLALRFRGALGKKLYDLGPPKTLWHNSCVRARAWDVLMEPIGHEIAKPMTVQVDVSATHITITVRLVGMADYWRPDVTAALLAALDEGIKSHDHGHYLMPLSIESVKGGALGGCELFQGPANEARLIFETPLRLRHERATRVSAASFLISLANRVKTLAPWHLTKLVEDWDSLHKAAWAIEDDCHALLPYYWSRGSRRVQGRVPMLGFVGTLVLRGPLQRFVPYLQICEKMNAGSHASLGLGRYKLSFLP